MLLRKLSFLAVFSCCLVTSAIAAITPAQEEALKAAAGDDAGCAAVAARLAAEDAANVADIAGGATRICGDNAAALIATTLAEAYPDRLEDIVVAMVTAKPVLVAEIVTASLVNIPDAERETRLGGLLDALRSRVPGIEQQPGFAALADGTGGTTGGLSAPQLGGNAVSPN